MTSTPPLVVAQLSDTHLFADEQQALLGLPTARSLQTVLKELRALDPRPDLLLLTGDLSQDETPASYQRLQTLIAPLKIPTYWIPGNHDQVPVMEQMLRSNPLSAEKSFQQGGWNFVLLNSAVPGCVHGALSPDRLRWLEQQLEASGDRPTLIALHHPPLAIASDWMDAINLHHPEALLTIMSRHPQMKLVLFGHIHQAFEQSYQGVRFLGAPSTCVQFKPKSREFAVDELKPGFRLLHLYSDGSFTTQIKRVKDVCQLDLAATGY